MWARNSWKNLGGVELQAVQETHFAGGQPPHATVLAGRTLQSARSTITSILRSRVFHTHKLSLATGMHEPKCAKPKQDPLRSTAKKASERRSHRPAVQPHLDEKGLENFSFPSLTAANTAIWTNGGDRICMSSRPL